MAGTIPGETKREGQRNKRHTARFPKKRERELVALVIHMYQHLCVSYHNDAGMYVASNYTCARSCVGGDCSKSMHVCTFSLLP
jgi:hypothetical protein